jgi:uncharacterized membrane protein
MDPAPPLQLACPDCAAQMPETAAFCPACGRPMQSAIPSKAKVGRLTENVAGALAYLTFIPAIIFMCIEPYKRNRFVLFHSIQCLSSWVILLLVAAVLRFTGAAVFRLPLVGPPLVFMVPVLAVLAAFLIWLVLVIKAFQGEMFKLPLLGELADRRVRSIEL